VIKVISTLGVCTPTCTQLLLLLLLLLWMVMITQQRSDAQYFAAYEENSFTPKSRF